MEVWRPCLQRARHQSATGKSDGGEGAEPLAFRTFKLNDRWYNAAALQRKCRSSVPGMHQGTRRRLGDANTVHTRGQNAAGIAGPLARRI